MLIDEINSTIPIDMALWDLVENDRENGREGRGQLASWHPKHDIYYLHMYYIANLIGL